MHRLESEQLSFTVLPERGAKIASFYHEPTATELLWQPAGDGGGTAADYKTAASVAAGIAFDAEQGWGWDEMFPAIHAERFEDESGRRVDVPDHGEVWTMPWEVLQSSGETSVTLGVTSPSMGYRLRRTTTLRASSVLHEYELENTGEAELPWMWAAHPLFVLRAGSSLQVPGIWDTVRNAHESPAMPEYDRLYPYPGAGTGSEPRLDTLPAPDSGSTLKYFFERPNDDPELGITLSQPSISLDISVTADPRIVPWYGIWCNAGGLWGHNNVAIEPASAPMDSLSAAERLGRLPRLAAGDRVSWWMLVSVTAY